MRISCNGSIHPIRDVPVSSFFPSPRIGFIDISYINTYMYIYIYIYDPAPAVLGISISEAVAF